MREGIKAGACGDEVGHSHGQFRVADHNRGQEFRVEDDLFLFGHRVGDDRCTAHFGPCARRRRNGNDRRDRICVGAGPPIADIFKIPKRARLTRQERPPILPRSRPEPPPKATTPSCPPRYRLSHRLAFFSFGFGSTSENIARPRPAASSRSSVLVVMAMLASRDPSPSRGLLIPALAQASAFQKYGQRQNG